MDIELDRDSKTPLYRQIAAQLRALILCGEISPGSRLPSERSMAQLLGVHRNTVVKAYTELKDGQLITARQGACYEVSLPADMPQTKGGQRVHWPSQIKSAYLDMEATFGDPSQHPRRGRGKSGNIAEGDLPAPGIYDWEKVAADLTSILREEGHAQPPDSLNLGDLTLRRRLVSFLGAKGIKATSGEMQILTGSEQALELLTALLVRPGDTVIAEEPASPAVYRCMQLAGAKVVTVPVDADGMQCASLDALLTCCQPRLLCVSSGFQDPTGGLLSQDRRLAIVETAARHRVPIIEMDTASELVYEGPRHLPLKALDRLGNVIYVYSFSLTFVPGLPIAFVAGDRQLIRSLSCLLAARMAPADSPAQKLLGRYLGDGSYYQTLERYRRTYAAARDLVCRRLEGMAPLGLTYEKPVGGVYIWCRLPRGLDSVTLAAATRRRGLSIRPGSAFYPSGGGGRDRIRLCYACESEARLEREMDALESVIREALKKRTAGP